MWLPDALSGSRVFEDIHFQIWIGITRFCIDRRRFLPYDNYKWRDAPIMKTGQEEDDS